MCLAYAIGFLCFLRPAEIMQIEWRHIRVHFADDGSVFVELRLDYRKTKQQGGMYNCRDLYATLTVFQILSPSFSTKTEKSHG